MTDKLKQKVIEEMVKLPKEMQEAISAHDWAKISEDIGKKYLLDEIEINNLQVETLLVLVGIEDGNYLAQNIENEVGTSKEEAEKIAEEVSQKIFNPLIQMLEEQIKKNMPTKSLNWNQNVDFVLSGGDYTAFLGERSDTIKK